MYLACGKRPTGKALLLLGSFLVAVYLLSLHACAPAATQAPAAPEAPAEPGEPGVGYPVQYGQDSRMEAYQHPDPRLREMAASVAIFVHKDQVRLAGDEATLAGDTLNERSEQGWLVSGAQLPMCPDELFAAQRAPGFCTGFLVAEDLVVTAGHCLVKTPCADTRIVFGYQMQPADRLAPLTREDVFACAQVLEQELPSEENGFLDYALLRLDRPAGRAGLAYTTGDQLQAQDNVAVLGYPSGLPLKIASNAFVLGNEAGNSYFVANLDTFGSNSGSPVINVDTYQVEGILVRGITDYVLAQDGTCVQVNRCPDRGDANCAGENATKMGKVSGEISKWVAQGPGGWNCAPNLLLALVLLSVRADKRFFKNPVD